MKKTTVSELTISGTRTDICSVHEPRIAASCCATDSAPGLQNARIPSKASGGAIIIPTPDAT